VIGAVETENRKYLITSETQYAQPSRLNCALFSSATQVHSVVDQARQTFQELLAVIDSSPTDFSEEVKVILYFDEAHTLSESPRPRLSGKTLYDILCAALNNFVPDSFFVVFLSTTTRLGELPPSHTLAKSARPRENSHHFLAPITETLFNISGTFPVHSQEYTLQQTSTVAFMSNFSRPT
jgi:hypothetical protein